MARWARRGMRGRGSAASLASNYSSVSLYNNSSGAESLIVRWVNNYQTQTLGLGFWWQQGVFGATAGKWEPITATQALLAGQVWSNQTTVAPTLYYETFNLSIHHVVTPEWPIAVIPPGWSLVAGVNTVATGVFVSWLWEAVPASEFFEAEQDFMVAMNQPPT